MKLLKLLIGLVSILPLLGLGGFAVAVLGFLARAFKVVDPAVGASLHQYGLAAFALSFVVAVPLVLAYVCYVAFSSLAADRKLLWIAILLFGNVVALPVAWFNFVYRRAA